MILVLLFVGAAIGIAWSRWAAMETRIANHDARLLILETDCAKRMQVKAWAALIVGIASKCLHKVSFGLIKAR